MIEVFADVVCPFTHVGLRRLVARRDAEGRTDVRLRVRAWPLELVNDGPVDPEFIADEIAVIRGSVSPGLFSAFDPASFPASSIPALAVTAAAYEVGAATGEAVALDLRDLLFEQATDIADPGVLADLAERHGLAPDAHTRAQPVHDDYAEGQRRSVKGSPHFFVGGIDAFCPSLDISKPDGHLHVEFDQVGFDEFATRALIAG